ncbi:MAG: hypothetical protein ACYDCL_07875 [Myxococcales bacterium]
MERAYRTHRIAARGLERLVGRWRLGFASGLDYFVAACIPGARPVLEAAHLGLPAPEGSGWLSELDESLSQLVEGLEILLGQPSRKPREERIVDMLRRFGKDPFPKLTPAGATEPPSGSRRPLGHRRLPHQLRGARGPVPAFAFGVRRRRAARA